MMVFLKGFKEGARCVGELISGLFNTLLLFIVYIFIVGPTAIIAKIVKKKFLATENPGWLDVEEKQPTKDSFYRQF